MVGDEPSTARGTHAKHVPASATVRIKPSSRNCFGNRFTSKTSIVRASASETATAATAAAAREASAAAAARKAAA